MGIEIEVRHFNVGRLLFCDNIDKSHGYFWVEDDEIKLRQFAVFILRCSACISTKK